MSNSSIAGNLQDIKVLLTVIVVILGIGVLRSTIQTVFDFKHRYVNAQAQLRDRLLAEISLLESQGDYGAMLDKAESFLELYPQDLGGNWSFAMANFHLKQYEPALFAFRKLKSLGGGWAEDTIDPLIQELESKLGVSKR